jgi:hypothetical protein
MCFSLANICGGWRVINKTDTISNANTTMDKQQICLCYVWKYSADSQQLKIKAPLMKSLDLLSPLQSVTTSSPQPSAQALWNTQMSLQQPNLFCAMAYDGDRDPTVVFKLGALRLN